MANKIIVLELARNKYRPNSCKHRKWVIDEELMTVECGQCGEKLNPISMLARLSREESQAFNQCQQLKEIKTKLDKKLRTKCHHCGKFTPVK